MNGLDLFSGIGGITKALDQWVTPVAYCENDRFSQSVLLSRMQDGELPMAPIWDDVRTLQGKPLAGHIDIIYGGFPCQDISIAGPGVGLAGPRSRLFYEILRLCQEIRPRFVFLENVPSIRTRGAAIVAKELACLGYDFKWDVVSASEVGAPHLRKRWFLLAHSNSIDIRIKQRWSNGEKWKEPIQSSVHVEDGTYPNINSQSKRIRQSSKWNQNIKSLWTMESDNWDDNAKFFLRVDNGVSNRAHQVKCLGNSVVPIQAKEAFKRLCGLP